MGRPWIKIESDTPNKPEVCIIATKLKLDPDMVIGKLVRLWAWAEQNIDKSNTVPVTREFLDRLVGQKGFAAAMEKAGWLEGDEGELTFPNFSRHNGKLARVRAQTAERVSRHRARKRLEGNSDDVNSSVTEAVNGDADRPQTERPKRKKSTEEKGVKTNVNPVDDSENMADRNTLNDTTVASPPPIESHPQAATDDEGTEIQSIVTTSVSVEEQSPEAEEARPEALEHTEQATGDEAAPVKNQRKRKEQGVDQPMLF